MIFCIYFHLVLIKNHNVHVLCESKSVINLDLNWKQSFLINVTPQLAAISSATMWYSTQIRPIVCVHFALPKIAKDKEATVAIACSFAVHFADVNPSYNNHLSQGTLGTSLLG
jgi:hypothetical protein